VDGGIHADHLLVLLDALLLFPIVPLVEPVDGLLSLQNRLLLLPLALLVPLLDLGRLFLFPSEDGGGVLFG
jgi:hypothetical protein